MAEADSINLFAFLPNEGGLGARISASSVSSAVAIPGTEASGLDRLLISNRGNSAASIRMGSAGVTATTACLEILPGTQVLLSSTYVSQSALWVAAITESGTTTSLQITAGKGT